MKKLSQEEIWNKIAGDWSRFRTVPIPEVVEFLKDKRGKLLDLGCGSGRNMIKQEGLEYYGVDFSNAMLKFAKEKADKIGMTIKLAKSGADKLDYDDEFFDFAIYISALHCIENETLRKKSLEELYRVMKIGGEIMVSVWDKSRDEDMKDLETNGGYVDWNKNGEIFKRYYYFYDKDELIYLLGEVGFEIVKISEYGDGKHEKKNIVVYLKK